jgi:hypothetical protein
LTRRNQPVSDHLHPLIYRAMIGLALWFVLSAWLLFGFGNGHYLGLLLAVVSLFLLISVALPYLICRSRRKFQGPDATGKDGESLRDWLSGEFDTPGSAG